MKAATAIACVLALGCLVGCQNDAPDNTKITTTANDLAQASKGQPHAPPIPGLQQAGGGAGGAAGMAAKPHGGKR